MSYKEVANKLMRYQTRATVYSPYSDLLQPQDIEIMPASQVTHEGVCQVRILQGESGTTVIATEIDINPGASVTNAVEAIATQAVKDFSLDPHRTRFIEHYAQESYEERNRNEPETYDEVSFTWQDSTATNPQWRRLQSEEIADLADIL